MRTVLITGGSGLIGSALTRALLKKNYSVIILTRNKGKRNRALPGVSYAEWNLEAQTIDSSAISQADYIVHLAGAGIADKRWTSKRKREIIESRTLSSHLIVKFLNEHANKVQAVVSASGIGWYGAATFGDKGTDTNPFVETDPAADDFLGSACKQWEASIDPVASIGKRLVKFRTAIVLSNEGGALKEFRKPLRFGIAAILGSGKQTMSWIHIDDIVSLYIYAIENEMLNGVYNAVAPQPLTNKKFTLQLARSMRGRFFVPIFVPSFILELALGDVSSEVLKTAAVSCEKVKKEGYTFLYPSIVAALHHLK